MTDTPATPTTEWEWSWLIDSYDDGTVFITDDPHDSQAPIADGLRKNVARAIVNAHNRTLAEARSTPAEPLDVDTLAAALDVLSDDGLEYDLMAPEEREDRDEVARMLADAYAARLSRNEDTP